MNNTLTIAKGQDYWIQNLQTRFYNIMSAKWNLTDNTWNSYGRVYVNRYKGNQDEGYIPEWFTNSGNEYSKDLFFNDTVTANSFFVSLDPVKVSNGESLVNVQWLFFVNLAQMTVGGVPLNKQAGQRLDELFVNDVENFIRVNGTGNFTIKSILKRVDKVLDQFSGKIKKDALTYDMQPLFCCRFDLTFIYNSFLNQ